ncbi:transposable element Tcb2 transposase [Trichonephila clavipes]|nr:transposable element Tcb2 transposase [Trichonephila clavipes]
MSWPANSPDLNSIEHAWDILGRQIAAFSHPPSSITELKRALQEAWNPFEPTTHSSPHSKYEKKFIRFSNLVQNRCSEKMTRRKSLSPDEIANLLRDFSGNQSEGGELSCSNLDSDEDVRLSEKDCK